MWLAVANGTLADINASSVLVCIGSPSCPLRKANPGWLQLLQPEAQNRHMCNRLESNSLLKSKCRLPVSLSPEEKEKVVRHVVSSSGH